jgi:hypothetical protein
MVLFLQYAALVRIKRMEMSTVVMTALRVAAKTIEPEGDYNFFVTNGKLPGTGWFEFEFCKKLNYCISPPNPFTVASVLRPSPEELPLINAVLRRFIKEGLLMQYSALELATCAIDISAKRYDRSSPTDVSTNASSSAVNPADGDSVQPKDVATSRVEASTIAEAILDTGAELYQFFCSEGNTSVESLSQEALPETLSPFSFADDDMNNPLASQEVLTPSDHDWSSNFSEYCSSPEVFFSRGNDPRVCNRRRGREDENEEDGLGSQLKKRLRRN